MTSIRHSYDAVVVGGGVIGLTVAWQSARQGLSVCLVDPHPGQGASGVAAGMLAPVTELHYGETALLHLNQVSAARYPGFVEELEDASGLPVGYRTCGTLAVALDADDRAVLDDLHRFQQELGLPSQRMSYRQCREIEPMLSPAISSGLFVANDHQVDNRKLIAALLAAIEIAGVTLIRTEATRVEYTSYGVSAVQLSGGDRISSRYVVLAAGCQSTQLAGVPEELAHLVRPVKGQIMRLHMSPSRPLPLSHNIRGTARGGDVYLVPRVTGELVVGATVEEQGWDTRVTAGGIYELLRDAHSLVPGIAEFPIVETLAGLRPGSRDNAPILGPTAHDGLVLATGHYRNGILLAPITGEVITDLLLTGHLPEVAEPFTLNRFSADRSAEPSIRPEMGLTI